VKRHTYDHPLAANVKKTGSNIKFKLRCAKYLYTLVLADAEKAKKLRSSLPPSECMFTERDCIRDTNVFI
jgi:hypothetical protein